MPQLRHADSSALLAEAADPLDLVLIAATVGMDRVLFDDVGPDFDAAAALAAVQERAAAAAAPDTTGLDDDVTERVAAQATELAARTARLEGPVAEAVDAALDAGPDVQPIVVDG